MVPFRLIYRNIMAHKLRTLLTVGSMAVALLLLCFLHSMVIALTAGVEASAAGRLIVQSAVSLYVDLPQSYQQRIDQIDGVEQTCKLQWFGGVYQDESNFFAQFAVDPERLPQTYPEMKVIEGDVQTFQSNRQACLVGIDLMDRFPEWQIGGKVPILGTIFPGDWEFEIAGVYESDSANFDNAQFLFHYTYLEETLKSQNNGATPGVGVYTVKLAPGADPVQVSQQIDMLFESGPQRVQSTPEAEFQRQFVSMMGNIPTFLGSIGGGVVFAIFFGALNTMLLAARERTRDLGIMKALGFNDGVAFRLFLYESILVCAIGGAIGVLLALGTEDALGPLRAMFPLYEVKQSTMLYGWLLSLVIGVVAAIVPALRMKQLKPVLAFRSEG